ncbi:MAG: CDP-glycerol glycerophosphotransferase family protein [Candidatus Marinimicrobia bacterium]|nr:CDP-glycerol glycerophosphotransferase family protein [Candidatus Neomarinimicrobiota bacterium]
MANEISILFDAYHLYHLPQFDPLIDLLEKDNRFRVYYSTYSKNRKEEINICSSILKKRAGTFVFDVDEEKRVKKIRDLDLDVFICGWSRYDLDSFVSDKTLVGMIYHGVGIKPSYWRDNHKRLDLRFVEGEYRINQLRNYGIKTDLALTGFIKLDPLFNGSGPDSDQLKKELGLDSSKKTILFAPTFYPSSLEKIGMRLGDYTGEYNVILKPHLWTYFLDIFGEVNLKMQRELISNLIEKFDHIKLLEPEKYNILPYYLIADVLLTEASSTIYEMIALSKPVVVNRFYKLKLSHKLFRNRLYRARLNKEMNQDLENFCFIADKHLDVPYALETALIEKHKNYDSMKKYQTKMLYKLDGCAAVRARDEILERIKN